jgi:hypothetical protein
MLSLAEGGGKKINFIINYQVLIIMVSMYKSRRFSQILLDRSSLISALFYIMVTLSPSISWILNFLA